MSEPESGTCKHELYEQESAAYADGLCALCLADKVEQMKSALQKIDAIAVQKKRGAIAEAQKYARWGLGKRVTL